MSDTHYIVDELCVKTGKVSIGRDELTVERKFHVEGMNVSINNVDMKNNGVKNTPMLEDVHNAQKSKSKVKSTCRTYPNVINPDREVLIYESLSK